MNHCISAAAGAAVEESQDEVVQLLAAKLDTVDADAIKMDLNVEMVAQVEAKVASVRETLGEMAMSEQYMRTKRAQLLARTREREAQLAMQLAAEKEKEAAVSSMLYLSFQVKNLQILV